MATRTGPWSPSWARPLPLEKRGQIPGCDADGVTDTHVRQFASFAEVVDDRGAYAEELGHLADRKQRRACASPGEIL